MRTAAPAVALRDGHESTAVRRGRPAGPGGALTPAQRKAAQRQRDHAALYRAGALTEATTSGLLQAAGLAIGEGHTGTLGDLLRELGKRGGLLVTIRKA